MRFLRSLSPRARWALAYASLPTLALAGALGLWWSKAGPLEDLQRWTFDSFMRQEPRPWKPDYNVRIVDIDDESLARLGQWPWPRDLLARIVRKLDGLGATAVAFDVVFAEKDRASPESVAASLPRTPETAEVRARLERMPRHDADFARSLSEAPVVLGFAFSNTRNDVRPAHKGGFLFSSKSFDETLAGSLPDLYSGSVVPLPELQKAAHGIGSISTKSDRDGIHRRVPMLTRMGEAVFPSLSAEALRVARGARGFKVMAAGGHRDDAMGKGRRGIAEMKIAEYEVPLDEDGNFILYDSGHRQERFIPVWRVLEPGFDPALIDGRIIFVGTSAAGLKDQRNTPLDAGIPGVELHAQVIEQIRERVFVRRPYWADACEGLAIGIFGLLLIAVMPRLGALWGFLFAAAAIGLAWAAAWKAFVGSRLLVDPLYFSLVGGAIYLTTSVLNYLRTESEKRQVRGAFSRYMSPALVEQLAKDPTRLKLGGEMRDMTLMFSDIRGFTTISEQFDAHGLTQFINRYLTPMTQIVLDHQGTIDKYMGDCIMSFWNAPLDDAGHVMNACRAGLTMRRRLKELNVEWKAEAEAEGRKFIPIHAGIGINSGPCCVGNMGSDMRFDYSVLGDDVNLASRLEGQSKSYGVDIVLGPNTRQVAAGLAALELDLIKVKGKTVPVNIFTLLGDEALAGEARFKALAERHDSMLAAYRGQRWDEAGRLAAECKGEADAMGLGLEKLYHLYEDRLAACRAEPPAKDWDGVFTATTK